MKEITAEELIKKRKMVLMKYTKTVLLPIKVPVGKFCQGKTDGDEYARICEHFTREHGVPECTMMEYYICGSLKCDEEGRVLKPKECLELEEQKEG